MFRQKIGLALGGGGPKGLAHVGVIKTLEKYHIPIDYIAGTSVGAVVGGFYALTKDIGSIEKYVMDKNWFQMLSYLSDPSLQSGIFQGSRLESYIEGYVKGAAIESTKIPFIAVAADLRTAKKVELKSGPLSQAIRASSSIPMLFKPVSIGAYLLTDGAVVSSVPVETVKKMGADIVIAVQLNNEYEEDKAIEKANFIKIGEASFSIMARGIAKEEVKKADVLIKPNVSDIGWKSMLKQTEKVVGIESGIHAMEKHIALLEVIMKKNIIERFFSNLAKSFRG